MQAVFELKQIEQSWTNPSQPKKITAKEVVAELDQTFDLTEKNEPMFRVAKFSNDKVLIEYNRAYTLKGYEQPQSRTIWLEPHKAVEFSSLWNSNGVTKRLTLKNIGAHVAVKEKALDETNRAMTIEEEEEMPQNADETVDD